MWDDETDEEWWLFNLLVAIVDAADDVLLRDDEVDSFLACLVVLRDISFTRFALRKLLANK